MVATACLLLLLAGGASAVQQPNILLILGDDLGFGEISSVWPPQKTILTPRLTQLAAQSTVFTDAYAGAPQCTPSRTTLLTGRTLGAAPLKVNRQSTCGNITGQAFYGTFSHPTLAPACDAPMTLPASADPGAVPPFLPSLLRAQGYHTLHYGKWMIGEAGSVSDPAAVGFDYSFGTITGANGWEYFPSWQWVHNASSTGPERTHTRVPLPGNYDQRAPAGDETLCRSVFNASGHECTYNQDVYASKAAAYIESVGALSSPPPFFMYLAFHLPHANDGVAANSTLGLGCPVVTDAPYTNEPWPQVEKNHAAMVTKLDSLVGVVLDALDTSGLADDTIVVFASDNGATTEGGHSFQFFNSSGPFRGCKGCTTEGGFREPTMVRWPGKVAAGARSSYPWAYYDLLPTFLEAAGDKTLPPGVQGESVLPTWLGATQPQRILFWRFGLTSQPMQDWQPPRVFPTCTDYALAARQGDWKVLWWSDPTVPPELYNVTADPGEENDLGAVYPRLAAQLQEHSMALYDVADPMWPLTPCTVGSGRHSPLKICCAGTVE